MVERPPLKLINEKDEPVSRPPLNLLTEDDSVKKKELTGADLSSGSEAVQLNLEAPSTSSEVPAYAPADMRTKQEVAPGPLVKKPAHLITKQVVKKPVKEESSYAEDLYNALAAGSEKLGSSLANTPSFIYDVFAVPQNLVAKYTGLNVGTDAKKFAEGVGLPENKVAEYYEDAYKKTKKGIDEKYDKSITGYIENGDYLKAAQLIGVSVAESAPVSLSLAAGNYGGLSATASTVGGGLVFGADKKKELDENAPNMSEADKTSLALSTGLFEGMFEQFGITKLGGIAKGVIEKEGKDAAKEVIEKTFKESYMPIAKKYLGVMAEESVSEAATQFAQNAVDKYSGYKPDLGLMDGVADAAIVGLASSKIMSAPLLTADIYKSSKNREAAKTLLEKKKAVESDISSLDIPAEAKDALSDASKNINEQLSDLYSDDKNKYNELPDDVKSVVDEKSEAIIKIDQSIQAEGLSEDSKQALLDTKQNLESEVDNLLTKTKTDEKVSEKISESISEEEKSGEVGEGEKGVLGAEQVVEQAPVVSEAKSELPAQEGFTEDVKPERQITSDVKKTIEVTTGVKPAKEKIASDVKTLLKKQIKDEARGANWGFKEAMSKGRQSMAFAKGQSEAFANRVGEILKDPNNKLRGKLSGKQVSSIINKATNIKSYKELHSFDDYIQKVVDNENYVEDLRTASVVKKFISKKTKVKDKKSKPLVNNIDVQKAFLKINPNEVEDINEYLDVANKIKENQKGVKVKRADGGYEISGDSLSINNKQIENYASRVLGEIENKKKARLEEDYDYLVQEGLIDKDKMSLKDMQDVVDASETSEEEVDNIIDNLSPSELEEKSKALRSLINYKIMEIQPYVESRGLDDFSSVEKGVINGIQNIDLSGLDMKQMTRLNDVINNIINNNNFAGAGAFENISNVQKNVKAMSSAIEKSGIEMGDISGMVIDGLTSKDLMIEFMAKSGKLAAEIKRLTGIDNIFNGNAKAKIAQNELFKDYENLKKGMSKNIDSPENRIRRGVYAKVVQTTGGDSGSISEDFILSKKQIEDTYNRLHGENSTEEEKKEGDIIEVVYNELLKDSNSSDEVRAKLDKLNNDNGKIVDFFIDKFAEKVDLFEEQSEVYSNEAFDRWENYTSTKTKRHGSLEDIRAEEVKDKFKRNLFNADLQSKKSKARIKRVKGGLGKNRVLDLDFDRIQFERYFESDYDMETSKAIDQVAQTFTYPGIGKMLGGAQNTKTLLDTIKQSVKQQTGDYLPLTKVERAVINGLNVVQAKGARMVLGSPAQFLQQYPTVAMSSVINLGRDADLFFKAFSVPNNIKLFDKYNIGVRGETAAGYNKDSIIKSVDKINFSGPMEGHARKINKLAEKISDATFKVLTASDISVARTSWLAYYMKSLRDQGVDMSNIDWKEEHNNPNEVAASYAEQMVSRTQGPNDASSMANAYKNTRDGWGKAVRGAAMPFSGFALNQRGRMTNDMQKLIFGGDRKESVKSLLATTAEIAAFNWLKIFAIGAFTTWAAGQVLSYFDLGEDDDDKGEADKIKVKIGEKEIETNKKYKKMLGSSASDFLFSGMGSGPQHVFNHMVNSIYGINAQEEYIMKTDRGLRKRVNEKPELIYQYKPKNQEEDFGGWGVYGILPGKIMGMYEQSQYLDGTFDKTVGKDGLGRERKREMKLTPEEANLVRLTFFVDALSVAGLSDAQVSTINQKIKTSLDKSIQGRGK